MSTEKDADLSTRNISYHRSFFTVCSIVQNVKLWGKTRFLGSRPKSRKWATRTFLGAKAAQNQENGQRRSYSYSMWNSRYSMWNSARVPTLSSTVFCDRGGALMNHSAALMNHLSRQTTSFTVYPTVLSSEAVRQ